MSLDPSANSSSSSLNNNNNNNNESISSNSSSSANSPSYTFSSVLDQDNISVFDLLDQFKLTNELSKKTRAFTTKQKQKFKSKININDDDLKNLKNLMNKRLDKFYKNLSITINASKSEKLYYAFNLYIIFFAGILIGKYPNYFHIFYSILFLILIPIRILTYYKIGYGYYLMDLCYFVNILLLLFIWIFPYSKMLFITCFAFSNGTLSFAVITWRNSLVLHSIDKTTSSFIHIIPPVVMYVITHQISNDYQKLRFSGAYKINEWNFFYGILYTSIYYSIWQLSYHYFITIKRAKKIKAGRVTSFQYLRKSYSNTKIGKFVNSLPEPFPVLAFTLIQYSYQLITMSICPLLFKYKSFHSIFLSFIFFAASYNGANYYIEVYGKKLEKEVIRLQQEVAQLQNSNNSIPVETTTTTVDSNHVVIDAPESIKDK